MEAVQKDLSSVVQWFDQIKEANIPPNLTPLRSPHDAIINPVDAGRGVTLRLRSDEVTDGDNAEAVLSNAPNRESQFFVVPKRSGESGDDNSGRENEH